MNQRQKEVQQLFLDNEKAVLKELERNYRDALAEINGKIEVLTARNDADLAHVIYRIEHQKALRAQVEASLESLHTNEFETVSEFLAKSYEDGFVGTMYDMHGQGVPLVLPIDQKQVIEAIQHETKLKARLYTEMGHDIKKLQEKIAEEISRGISTGQSTGEIARNLASYAKIPQNRAMTIARTESHRIQCHATSDAQHKAKEKGADILRQWDAALDGDTRPTHRQLDGQIRELDEPFEVAGKKAKYPGAFGDPAEDCNCRCALLQRARWALGKEELDTLKDRAKYFGLDKTKDFTEFKNKYLKAAETLENTGKSGKMKAQPLTETDVKSINDYLGAKSYVINEKLRNGTELSNAEQEFVENLSRALEKVPTFEGNLQRSLLFYSEKEITDFMNRHKVGNKVTYAEFISTTKGETYNPEGQVQIFIQDAKNGRDISVLNPGENEVLYNMQSSFVVTNVVEQSGTYYILMGEADE